MKNRMNQYIMNELLLYSQHYDIRLLCRIMYNDPCFLCYLYIFYFSLWFLQNLSINYFYFFFPENNKMASQQQKLRQKSPSRGLLLLDYSLLLVLLATSVLLIIVGLSYVFSNWVLTTGTVTLDQGSLKGPTCIPLENTNNLYDCSFRARYKAVSDDGKINYYYVQVDHVIGPKVSRSDQIYLQYDPKNPSSVIYGNTSYKTFGLLYLSVGALLTLITVYYWSNIKKQQKLQLFN